ncbi:class I SAM-dependent methyltransferase [Nonomuraea gerenzanensis]|uniref:Methyltransferase n=1 Tax=Nonomuraea gerenzanensis TaxID=93944 RepID=A0A1M4E4P7_9ACTN|nr:class I SAM-dependent methyltransferase [Nonomuraea gerenzanensis]UBU16017.1 class I SAM-dependent methyltransferase [Nonomuraea gerenzanensis]SBO93819.1 Methyltransferase [Nonomuraea gerenzanensis]
MDFAELIHQAQAAPFEGWDFSVLRGRVTYDGALPWDYERLASDHLATATSLLDLGTGGGELLASLAPLPPRAAATEGHPPNLPVARSRLAPLGVEVAAHPRAFPGDCFDLVLNRHERYDPAEVRRLLAPGGTYLTQQVSGRDLEELNAALGGPPHPDRDWDLAAAAAGLGLRITWSAQGSFTTTFHDIGALVLFLRAVSWQVPGFEVSAYEERLRALHEDMIRGRPLKATARRFALLAVAP